MNLIAIAKAPVAGVSKTRLCPPCTPEQAATVAEAALADTLLVLASAAEEIGARAVLALDGAVGAWLPPGLEVICQRGDGLDERLAHAFDDAGAPGLLVGMDTPQITSTLLSEAVRLMQGPDIDAVIGEAVDGGWWAIGLREANERVFLGVPMSAATTCAEQRARLAALDLTVGELPVLRDVDTFDDAVSVAAEAPATRFAAAVAGLASTSVVEL